ncbi:MAG: 2-oxoacid:acceptor oxidoreductase subunit alpha [Bacillota bacterium]|nr:2-oxoacid:acceptor oxidoreductase subunit alpha [Bacillota bacterium]MDW7684786.1 2-oxoacid:acceptor oxidoreductase subunit alpha [Bacillota bacterium]
MSRFKFMQGNEACVEGAIAAGARFFAGYPITPSSEVAQAASLRLPGLGGYYLQMEDEISGLAAVIGASLSGLKAFTATSGPGFSLMQENLGMAIMGEVPCVIINVSRGGPSTGLATKQAQGDVMQTRWGTHGDHSSIVLTPAGVQECFDLTVRAFNLAEKYRTPVIVLTDKTVGHLRERIKIREPAELEIIDRKKPVGPPAAYKSCAPDADGIPPLACYGDEYLLRINSSMHGEDGFISGCTENATTFGRRLREKIEANTDDICAVAGFGLDDAETVLLSFGISARSSWRAMTLARRAGRKVGLIQLLTLWPFPADKIRAALGPACKRLMVVELNMGQLALEVERVFCDKPVLRVNKWCGEDILPGEILAALKEADC